MELIDSSTGMNFTENQHGSVILDKLKSQRDGSKFCDVVFHVHEKEFHAHRNVLAACSPYFESMLKMKSEKEHVTVNCTQHQTFDVLLNYLYTGKVVIDEDNIQELLQLSNQFMVGKLKGYCNEYLERSMHISSVFKIKEMAEKCGLPQLAKTADACIFANLREIIDQEEILHFSPAKMDNLLSNKSIPLTEDMRLHIICRWVKYELASRQFNIQGLLNHIQWDRINIQTMYSLLGIENSIFLESEWCMFQILQCLDESRLLFHLYRDTYNNLRQKFKKHDQLTDHINTVERVVRAAIGAPDLEHLTNICMETHQSVNWQPSFAKCISSNQSEVKHINEDYSVPNLTIDKGQDSSGSILDRNTSICSPSPKQSTPRKNKRKNSPIKVRIPKSKIKLEVKLPKKRGRQLKANHQEQVRTGGEKIASSKISTTPSRTDSGGSDGENHLKDSSDEDDNYVSNADFVSDDDICNKRNPEQETPTKKKRKSRKKRITAEKINCPKCYFVTTSETKMDAHITKAHKDNTTFQCGLCDFSSKWNREYYKHMKNHFSGPPYQCDYAACDYASDRIQFMLYHRMKHTDEKPFSCSVCNMKFRTRNNLTTHSRCHTGEKPFECEVCRRRFATKGTMDQHMVTHSDHRPYLCDTCGFSTKYQSHLIAHKRIHTGDVFRCQFPSCKYFTPKRSQLACHMRSHMDIRQHICSVCGRGFVEKSHLVRHERIHLEEKPFQCDQCDYSSTRRDKLKEHFTKHHGEGASAKVPYKPRKPRKQTFTPQAYPNVMPNTSEPNYPPSDNRTKTSNIQTNSEQTERPHIAQTPMHEQFQYVSHPEGSQPVDPPVEPTSEMSQVLDTVPSAAPPITVSTATQQSTVDARSIGLLMDSRNLNIGPLAQQPLNLVQPVVPQRSETLSGASQGYHISQTSSQQDFSGVSGFMGIF